MLKKKNNLHKKKYIKLLNFQQTQVNKDDEEQDEGLEGGHADVEGMF